MVNQPQIDVSTENVEKLTNIFKGVQERVSVDEEVMTVRNTLKAFNEYLYDEKNNIHHNELCDALDTGEDVAAVIPRNSAKSTIASTRYPSYRLGHDRGVRVIMGSHTAVLAQSFARSMEAIFEDEKFKLLFGQMKPPGSMTYLKWNETEKMVIDRPNRNKLGYRIDAKDANIFAVGVGGAVVGRRADLIILDDIIDRDSVKTEAQLTDTKFWFSEELKGCRHAHTQTVIVGSRWNARDIYIEIMSTMAINGATITGNMVEEVLDQMRRFRELENEMNA